MAELLVSTGRGKGAGVTIGGKAGGAAGSIAATSALLTGAGVTSAGSGGSTGGSRALVAGGSYSLARASSQPSGWPPFSAMLGGGPGTDGAGDSDDSTGTWLGSSLTGASPE